MQNKNMMVGLTKIGSVLAFIGFFLALFVELEFFNEDLNIELLIETADINGFAFTNEIRYIIGLIGAGIALFCAIKPDESLPFNWIVLMVLSIWILVFGCLLGGLFILFASIIGILEKTKTYSDRIKNSISRSFNKK